MTSVKVLLLSGGVGGAKLALGLDRLLPRGALATLVNTADDFEHWGLRICPDLDTVLYTLAGVVHREQGWGRADDTFQVLEEMRCRGAEDWFRLGDKDIALHLERTARLRAGESLTEIMRDCAQRFGLGTQLLPMSDDVVATAVVTATETLPFQEYFVRHRCEPIASALRYVGSERARISSELEALLTSGSLEAIIVAPSNPLLSIAPMLAISGLRAALRAASVPIVAVSPLIAGQAVKGPTVKIMKELGLGASLAGLATCYAGFVDGYVVDSQDELEAATLGMPIALTDTLMQSLDDRLRVATAALALARNLRDVDYRRSA